MPDVIQRPPNDYTSRDFEAITDSMIKSIPFYTEEWTDNNASDFGIAMIELLAQQLGILHHYVDNLHFERFLKFAKRRRSVVELNRLIDYQLRSASPAKVDLTFSIATPLAQDLLIPKGTQVQTSSNDAPPVFFETADDGLLLAGQTEVLISAVEGETVNEQLGISNQTVFQTFELERFPVIDDTVQVFVDEGVGDEEWTLVETTIDSVGTSKHYTIEKDENDQVTVEFGNNNQGKIPDNLANISSIYRVLSALRGNVIGNVGAGSINTVITPISLGGQPIAVNVTNNEQANGGETEESLEEAKRQGPRNLRRLYRFVTLEDYNTGAETFPGVLFGNALVRKDAVTCCDIDVHIVPSGGGLPSLLLKEDLKEFYERSAMPNVIHRVLDPVYVPIDIEANVFVDEGFNKFNIEEIIKSRFDILFSLKTDAIDSGTGIKIIAKFDRDVFLSDIMCLQAINGVNHIDLLKVSRQPVAFLKLWTGNAEFENLSVGPNSVVEEWEVRLVTPTTFNVTGSVSGIQGSGQMGVGFTTNNGNLSFILNAGTTANGSGDVACIRTSLFLGNVGIDFNEVPQKGQIDLSFTQL